MRWVLAVWRALVNALWRDEAIDHAVIRRRLSWLGHASVAPGSWEVWVREEKRRDEWACARARVTRLSPTDCRLVIDWVGGDDEIAAIAADYAISHGVDPALSFASQLLAVSSGVPKFYRGRRTS